MSNRRNFIINKSFQTRFALELTAIVLLVPIAIWVNYFILGQYVLIDEMGGPEAELSWGVVTGLLSSQWYMVLLLYVINVVLVGSLVLRYAHRVAGPVYRFNQTLFGLSTGSARACTLLRPTDYFKELGDSMENLCASIKKDVDALDEIAEQLTHSSDSRLQQHAVTMKSVIERVCSD